MGVVGVVCAALVLLAIVSIIMLDRARRAAERMSLLYKATMDDVIAMSKNTSEVESIARESLKKVAKIRKQRVKELTRDLDELQAIHDEMTMEGEDDEEEDEESVDDASRSVLTPHRKTNDKIANMFLTLQNRVRQARDRMDGMVANNKIDAHSAEQLTAMLDVSLDTLEKESKKKYE